MGCSARYTPTTSLTPVKTNSLLLSSADTELLHDAGAGMQALGHYMDASWWKWHRGSRLHFGRWPNRLGQQSARDGFPVFVLKALPRHPSKQRPPPKELRKWVAEKVCDVRRKEYIAPRKTLSYIDFFAVPKTVDNNGNVMEIRMVYNGTSCGLNDCVWAPNFWMPTPHTAARQLDYNSYMIDIDLGEFFLNFPLHKRIQPHTGIDLKAIRDEAAKLGQPVESPEHWTWLLMGFRASPYMAVRFYYLAEEVIIGDPEDLDNPLSWQAVILNLPGMKNFDPRKPWVFRWNKRWSVIAGGIVMFVDDVRGSGFSLEHAWRVGMQLAQQIQYLGGQNAARKVRPPVKKPGAWAGCIFDTSDPDRITMTVSQDKWNKGRNLVESLWQEWKASSDGKVDYKEMERRRGFLIHLMMTYRFINPFLKGWHLTLDSWRPLRNEEGYKVKINEWENHLIHKINGLDHMAQRDIDNVLSQIYREINEKGAPKRVRPVPRFESDLKALRIFFDRDDPPKVPVRSSNLKHVYYGFGDASGNGFGSSIRTKEGLSLRIGVWGGDEQKESSNFREFENVVSALESEGRK